MSHIEYSTRVANLRDQIKWFMPLIEKNYEESKARFEGKIEGKTLKEGGLQLVSHRYSNAVMFTSMDIFPLTETETPESIFEANAMLVWDINSAISRLPAETEEKKIAEEKRDELIDLYCSNGFTVLNSFYKTPEKPVVVEEKQKTKFRNSKKLPSKKQALRLTA